MKWTSTLNKSTGYCQDDYYTVLLGQRLQVVNGNIDATANQKPLDAVRRQKMPQSLFVAVGVGDVGRVHQGIQLHFCHQTLIYLLDEIV